MFRQNLVEISSVVVIIVSVMASLFIWGLPPIRSQEEELPAPVAEVEAEEVEAVSQEEREEARKRAMRAIGDVMRSQGLPVRPIEEEAEVEEVEAEEVSSYEMEEEFQRNWAAARKPYIRFKEDVMRRQRHLFRNEWSSFLEEGRRKEWKLVKEVFRIMTSLNAKEVTDRHIVLAVSNLVDQGVFQLEWKGDTTRVDDLIPMEVYEDWGPVPFRFADVMAAFEKANPYLSLASYQEKAGHHEEKILKEYHAAVVKIGKRDITQRQFAEELEAEAEYWAGQLADRLSGLGISTTPVLILK